MWQTWTKKASNSCRRVKRRLDSSTMIPLLPYDHLANLYSDFLLCERVMRVPKDRGTSGYLRKAVPNVENLLANDKLGLREKVTALSELITKKRIGNWGHFNIDLFSLIGVIGITIFSLIMIVPTGKMNYYYFLSANILGLIFIIFSMRYFQKNPSKQLVEELVKKHLPSSKNSTQNGPNKPLQSTLWTRLLKVTRWLSVISVKWDKGG